MENFSALENLVQTVARLRAPGGCPRDSKQSHESLVPHLLEEVYELIEAIESGNAKDLIEELGDVLYQVIFHADIGKSSTADPCDIADIAAAVDEKMRSRHPHVFGNKGPTTPDEALEQWERIKREEKRDRKSVMDGIPARLSALSRADLVLKRSKHQLKIRENRSLSAESEADLGHLLLEIIYSARANGLDSERALRAATRNLEVKIRSEEQS